MNRRRLLPGVVVAGTVLVAGAVFGPQALSQSSDGQPPQQWASCMTQAGWAVTAGQDTIRVPADQRDAFVEAGRVCGDKASLPPAQGPVSEEQAAVELAGANDSLERFLSCMRERGHKLPAPVMNGEGVLELVDPGVAGQLAAADQEGMRADGEACERKTAPAGAQDVGPHPHN